MRTPRVILGTALTALAVVSGSIWTSCSKNDIRDTVPTTVEREDIGTAKACVPYFCKMNGGVGPFYWDIRYNCFTGMGQAIASGGLDREVQLVSFTASPQTLSMEGNTKDCGVSINPALLTLKGNTTTTCPVSSNWYYFVPNQGGATPSQRRVLKVQVKNLTALPACPPDLFFTYDVTTNNWTAHAGAATYFCWSITTLGALPANCC
jgi:hypothetical protein